MREDTLSNIESLHTAVRSNIDGEGAVLSGKHVVVKGPAHWSLLLRNDGGRQDLQITALGEGRPREEDVGACQINQ